MLFILIIILIRIAVLYCTLNFIHYTVQHSAVYFTKPCCKDVES